MVLVLVDFIVLFFYVICGYLINIILVDGLLDKFGFLWFVDVFEEIDVIKGLNVDVVSVIMVGGVINVSLKVLIVVV